MALRALNLKQQGTPLQFLTRFLIVFLPLYAIIELTTIYFSNNILTQTIASIQSALLNSIGIFANNSGNIIRTVGATFEVIPDCSGLMLIAMLAGLLYATRSVTNKHKLNILLLGGAVLLIFNLLRLTLTIYTFVNFGQNTFELTHFALWIIDSLLVITIWLLAINKNLQNSQ